MEQDRAQRHAGRVGEHGDLVTDAVRYSEQLGLVGVESLRMRAGGACAVAQVKRRGQRARREVAAPRVATRRACFANRVDPPRHAGQPGVEDHARSRVGAPGDRFVTEHVGEGQQRRQGIVEPAVEEDLLGVRSAQTRHGGLARHPTRTRRHGFRNVLQAHRRERPHIAPGVDPAADLGHRLPDQAVAEHQGLHGADPNGGSGTAPCP